VGRGPPILPGRHTARHVSPVAQPLHRRDGGLSPSAAIRRRDGGRSQPGGLSPSAAVTADIASQAD